MEIAIRNPSGVVRFEDRRVSRAEELQIFAWLYDRLAILQCERRDWRTRLRDFFGL